MNQDTEITQKLLSTTKEYTRGSLKSLNQKYLQCYISRKFDDSLTCQITGRRDYMTLKPFDSNKLLEIDINKTSDLNISTPHMLKINTNKKIHKNCMYKLYDV